MLFSEERQKNTWRSLRVCWKWVPGSSAHDFRRVSDWYRLAQTSHASPATSPLPQCLSEYPLSHHKCLFNCRVAGSGSWSQLIRPVTTRWLILTQLCSPVWLAAQLPICACGAGRRTLPPLCQHRLMLAKALVSLQLKELEPAFWQPSSVQSQH